MICKIENWNYDLNNKKFSYIKREISTTAHNKNALKYVQQKKLEIDFQVIRNVNKLKKESSFKKEYRRLFRIDVFVIFIYIWYFILLNCVY